MLRDLTVENLGVIERVEVALGEGSCALTGETGAGKTLLVASLGLLLGDRAERTLVRHGAAEARVEGRFTIAADHPAAARLLAHGVLEDDPEDEVEVVAVRTVSADGRGRTRINGRLVTTAVLAEIGGLLVEVAGQHAHHRVGSPAFQRRVLDAFSGPETVALAEEVAGHVRAATRARRALDELGVTERERGRELDLLEYEIAEIEGAAVEPGEGERLGAEARRLEDVEVLVSGLETAAGALAGEGGATDRLAGALATLRELVASDSELEDLVARLQGAAVELDDVARELRARVLEPDPERLEAVRERLSLLSRLARKYGSDEGDALAHLARARTRRDELRRAEQGSEDLERELAESLSSAEECAARLTKLRAEAARRLEGEMERLFGELSLDGAHFEVAIGARPLYEGGHDDVEFRVAMNGAEPAKPLAKVASGGELARVSLALHLLTASDTATTMVFDEVDAGVGGEAARSVGRALARLARGAGIQVLVVTHLPQVAALADHHLKVFKDGGTAGVVALNEDERVAELSRMMAGLPRSEHALDHARELLELRAEELAG